MPFKLHSSVSWFAAAFVVTLVLFSVIALWAINRDYQRVRAAGTVISSPYGDIEYTEGGSGPPVLVIHGSGGGYDQGELIAQTLLGDGFHWITPSRFGYLRSSLPEPASWDDQAHAYAYLLDQLGEEKVAVVAMSHGGPSALVFAVLYPERVSSLTLVSCGVAPSSAPNQSQANQKGDALTFIFRSDFVYWTISKLFKGQLMELIGATEAVMAKLTDPQRQSVERFIEYMNPASLRSAGVAFDNKTALPGKRIAAITAPTLIFHARDDTLQLYHNAEFAVSTIPNAELVSFEEGGHIVMIAEQATVSAMTREHINIHVNDSDL